MLLGHQFNEGLTRRREDAKGMLKTKFSSRLRVRHLSGLQLRTESSREYRAVYGAKVSPACQFNLESRSCARRKSGDTACCWETNAMRDSREDAKGMLKTKFSSRLRVRHLSDLHLRTESSRGYRAVMVRRSYRTFQFDLDLRDCACHPHPRGLSQSAR